MKLRRSRIGLVAALVLAACGDDPSAPPAGTHFELVVQGLPIADPDRDGTYEIWVYDARDSAGSAGRFTITNTQEQVVPFDLPVADARRVTVTLEPPNDEDLRPAAFKIMSGELRGATAELRIEGDITNGRPLEPNPGAHSLFTSSNNVQYGYPSLENAGLWLFSILPSQNAHKSREVKVTPLRPSWLYQGWVVWRIGTSESVWISYGQFRPDLLGLLNSRDHTGSGIFSGDIDYVNGGIEDVPGDEWTTNPFAMPVPGELTLPLALDSIDAAGNALWTHVITVEPGFQEGEPLLSERPFIPVYQNPIGAGGPGVPRVIRLISAVPQARVQAVH